MIPWHYLMTDACSLRQMSIKTRHSPRQRRQVTPLLTSPCFIELSMHHLISCSIRWALVLKSRRSWRHACAELRKISCRHCHPKPRVTRARPSPVRSIHVFYINSDRTCDFLYLFDETPGAWNSKIEVGKTEGSSGAHTVCCWRLTFIFSFLVVWNTTTLWLLFLWLVSFFYSLVSCLWPSGRRRLVARDI